jgi:hypothetical protein
MHYKYELFPIRLTERARANPKIVRTSGILVAGKGSVLRADKMAEVGILGALFCFVFWASKK